MTLACGNLRQMDDCHQCNCSQLFSDMTEMIYQYILTPIVYTYTHHDSCTVAILAP